MNLYTPILVLGAIAAAFAVGSVGIALLIGSVSALAPGLNAARTSILDALRYNG